MIILDFFLNIEHLKLHLVIVPSRPAGKLYHYIIMADLTDFHFLPCRTKTRRRRSERKMRRRLWQRPCWGDRVVLGGVALWAGQGPAAGWRAAVPPGLPAARAAPMAGGGPKPHRPSPTETVRRDPLSTLRQWSGELNSPSASLSVVQMPHAGGPGGRQACMTLTGPPMVSSTSYFPVPTSCLVP